MQTMTYEAAQVSAYPAGYEHYDADLVSSDFEPTKNGFTVYKRDIAKSPNDKRDYRLIRLPNGLEAMLVSDKESDKAAAALSVRCGSMQDPSSLQGLAHFCEHLLFQGSRKFPGFGEYDEFLSRHNGSSNASTGSSETEFHFDISPSKLGPALERFSGFFTSPLFREDCVDREVKAVDSEFKWREQNDCVRGEALLHHLAPADHPYHCFQWGNIVSLVDSAKEKGLDLREELIRFHERYYSANLMKLCILSNAKLDDLAKLVVKHFSSIRCSKLAPAFWPPLPSGPNDVKQQVHSLLVGNRRILDIHWPLEDQSHYYDTGPAAFIGHLLTREGEGSLLTWLKAKGWANGLAAGEGNAEPGFSSFLIAVTLTPEGLEHREEVASSLLREIEALRSVDIATLEPAFRDISAMEEIHFRFEEVGEAQDTVNDLASSLHGPFPRHAVITAQSLINKFDPVINRGVLDQLDTDKCRIAIKSQQPIEGLKYDLEEPWFKVKYGVEPLKEDFLERRRTPDSLQKASTIPPANPFIPVGLKAAEQTQDQPPMLIKTDSHGQLWYKRDAKFLTPKSKVSILFRVPHRMRTIRHRVLTRLYTDLIDEALNSITYDASVAGSEYAVCCDAEGMQLECNGYTNVKFDDFFNKVLEVIKTVESDEQTFRRIHDVVQRGYENFAKASALEQAGIMALHILDSGSHLPRQKLQVIESLKLHDVHVHRDALLARLNLQAYVHGSGLRSDALSLIKRVEQKIGFYTFPASETGKPRGRLLPNGKAFMYREVNTNPEDVNSALVMTYQICNESDDWHRVRVSWLADILEQPFYDDLRTKQQCGYIVQCHSECTGGIVSLNFQLQSEWHPSQIEERVLQFVEEARSYIAEMGKDELEEHRQGLIEGWLETFKTMEEEASYNWSQIDNGSFRFQHYLEQVALLRKAKRSDLLQLLDDCILAGGRFRALLSVHIISQRLQPSWLTPPATHKDLIDLLATKPNVYQLDEKVASLDLTAEERASVSKVHLWPHIAEEVQLITDIGAFRHGLMEALQPVASPQYAALFPKA